jgi:hypothetical protein
MVKGTKGLAVQIRNLSLLPGKVEISSRNVDNE